MNLVNKKISLVAIRIKEKRMLLNYTQDYVAHRLNISQNAYSKLECGLTSCTVERLFEIAEIFQTDIHFFICR